MCLNQRRVKEAGVALQTPKRPSLGGDVPSYCTLNGGSRAVDGWQMGTRKRILAYTFRVCNTMNDGSMSVVNYLPSDSRSTTRMRGICTASRNTFAE